MGRIVVLCWLGLCALAGFVSRPEMTLAGNRLYTVNRSGVFVEEILDDASIKDVRAPIFSDCHGEICAYINKPLARVQDFALKSGIWSPYYGAPLRMIL